MKKTIHLLCLLMALNACQQTSKRHHITVDSTTIDLWLEHRPLMQLQEKQHQIEAYAVEQHLIKQKHIIGKNQLNKLIFLQEVSLHAKSEPFIKRSIRTGITLKTKEVNDNIAMLENKQLNKKAKVRLYQIYKSYPPNAQPQDIERTKEAMYKIRSQVTDLASFKTLASLESESQSRLQSGLIGNVAEGKFPAAINDIVMNMKPNDISQVIIGQQGVLLFYCERIIPAKRQSTQQITQRVINTLTNHAMNQTFQAKKQQTITDLNLIIDWDAIASENKQNIAVRSAIGTLNNQQLAWLLNGNNNSKELSKYPKKNIERSIKNQQLNHYFYQQLSDKTKSEIKQKHHFSFQQRLASEVMATLVSQQLQKPNQQQEQAYFNDNKTNYIQSPRHHISAIALKIDPKNLIVSHKKAYDLWYNLKQGNIDFHQAFVQHSFLNEDYPNGYSVALKSTNIPQVLGIEPARQIKTMNVGDISLPVASEDRGILWILRLDKITAARAMTFQEAQKSIHQTLGNTAVKTLQNHITESIIDDLIINVVE